MPIVSSTHSVGHQQADGRRYVTEQHTDDIGAVIVVEYLAADGADYVTARDARASAMNTALAEREATELIG